MTQRSVMLAPNNLVSFSSHYITYPMIASSKLDGNRLLIKPDGLYTRNLKPFGNTQFETYLKPLWELAKQHSVVFDCEVYSPQLKFNQLQTFTKSYDYVIPDHIKAYVFDCVKLDEWNGLKRTPFQERVLLYTGLLADTKLSDSFRPLDQKLVYTAKEAENLYLDNLENGLEGLMLRMPASLYKHGRATLHEGTIFKFKQFVTMDCMIVGFNQRKQMTESYKNSDRPLNELGYLKRTHESSNFELIEEIGSVVVRTPENKVGSVSFSRNFSPADHGLTWNTRNSFLGRMVEIRYMDCGTKDFPRMGAITRFRPDLDETQDGKLYT